MSLEKFERFISNAFRNVGQSFYDHYVEANVDFRSRLGMNEVIIRRQLGNCCKWCASLAGIYSPSNAPKDIYKRHQNCRCLVTYKTEGGYQDVWSKKVFQTERDARIERHLRIEKERINGNNYVYREVEEKYKITIKDVTYQYYNEATPGKGNIDFEPDYKKRSRKDEITNAKRIFKRFGGDIILKTETNISKSADFFWNEALWELKSPKSIKGTDDLIHKAIKQISPNPGGIIVDYENNDVDYFSIVDSIAYRIGRSGRKIMPIDVMIIRKGKIYRIIRIK